MMSDDRRPDWNYWKNVPNWTILQAVALSLNIDPNKLYYRVLPGTMGLGKTRVESPGLEKRLSLALLNLDNDELSIIRKVKAELEKSEVKPASFAALAVRWWGSGVPAEMAALAEWTPLAPATKKSQKQSEAAIERHASKRERTLAAVIETIATADRQNYISETSQKIIVAKLAQLVEDNRFKYGNILNREGIEDIVGRILNGTYFA